MIADKIAKWREALLLPGEDDLVESGVRELAEYFGVSRDEARRACLSALDDSRREWNLSPRQTHAQVIDFYRHTRSYLFEHVWWHATDTAENSANVEILNYALGRGAREYLDFGSGVGSNAILFARSGFKVTLADVSETMLGFARWRMERRGLAAEFINLNHQQLPRGRFDLVTAVDLCEHLTSPDLEFKRIAESLKVGGAFVFNQRLGEDAARPMHILTTAAPVLRSIRRNGLREAAGEAAALRKLNFYVVERGAQSRIEDWLCGLSDYWRFNGHDAAGHGRAPHPQRIYFDHVKQSLNGSSRWLDLGCGRRIVPQWMKGQAELEAELKSRAAMLVGVDPDLAALGDNRSCPARVKADGIRLPFADGSFDLVVLLDTMEHIPDDHRALQEVRRVLRPGGIVFVSVPAYQFLWSQNDDIAHHCRRYTRRRLDAVLRAAGLQVERLSYFNTLLFPLILPAVLFQKLMARLGRLPKDYNNASVPIARPLNRLFTWIMSSERFLLRWLSLPFGHSALGLARRPAEDSRRHANGA